MTKPPSHSSDSISAAELLYADLDPSLRAAVADTDFETLSQMWSICAGPRVLMKQPRRVMLRTLVISHIVHHRAQLGVYYRLLGVPVPGVYGPSADDQPFA